MTGRIGSMGFTGLIFGTLGTLGIFGTPEGLLRSFQTIVLSLIKNRSATCANQIGGGAVATLQATSLRHCCVQGVGQADGGPAHALRRLASPTSSPTIQHCPAKSSSGIDMVVASFRSRAAESALELSLPVATPRGLAEFAPLSRNRRRTNAARSGTRATHTESRAASHSACAPRASTQPSWSPPSPTILKSPRSKSRWNSESGST